MKAAAALGAALIFLGGQAAAVEQPVQLETETGTLYGVLDVPPRCAPCTAAVIIAGSGPTDRDGNQPDLKNDSLKRLGQALAANGVAALRYDKRGVAQSANAAAREEDLRFETYVGDVVEWVARLRQDTRFRRVALVGHSEGSLIGMLAARQARVSGFVSVAGPGRRAATLLRTQLATLPPRLKDKSDAIIDELVAGRTVRDMPTELAALYRPSVQPYLISWFKYDPAREIGRLDMPVLIVQGTTDLQISVDDAKHLATAKRGSQLRLIEGMNHVLKRASGAEEQRAAYTNPSLPIDTEAAALIVAFLKAL